MGVETIPWLQYASQKHRTHRSDHPCDPVRRHGRPACPIALLDAKVPVVSIAMPGSRHRNLAKSVKVE